MFYKKLQIPLLVLFLLVTLVTGYMMYARYEAEELWSYLPLGFFIGLWGSIVVLAKMLFSKIDLNARLLGLSTLSGILLALGFPPFYSTSIIFIGFVPLLLVEQEIVNWNTKKSAWTVFKYAYHTFVVWNIFATYWVANTAFFAGVFAIWVNSLFMSIPFVLFHLAKKRMPNLGWAALVTFWITFEYLHLHHQLSWPWLTLGNSLSEYPSWIQWYEYTGVFGGTLWILLANVLFYKIVSNYYFHKSGFTIKSITKPFALVIIPILVSMGIYYSYEEQGREIEVVVVQPNFEPHYEKDSYNKADQYKYHTKLSYDNGTKETDYFIFPESSFSSLDERALNTNRVIKDLKDFLNRNFPESKLIMGVGSYRFFDETEEKPDAIRPHVRTTKNGKDTLYYEAYNAAFQVSNELGDVQIYHKSKLVPGAEFFPLKNILPFMQPLVDKLGGSVYGLGKQDKRSVFTAKDGTRMAPVICYESVYGEYTSDYVRTAGANALVIMTNDGWWDDTAGHKQHLQYATMRAIETRRGIARAANTGISGFINQRGEILGTTKYDEPVSLRGTITLNDKVTFYTKYRDLIARISLFLSALLILNLIAKTWLNKAKRD